MTQYQIKKTTYAINVTNTSSNPTQARCTWYNIMWSS